MLEHEFKIKLPIDVLAKKLGIDIKKENERYAYALCPFHNDTAPSFVMDKFRQTARCFSTSCAELGVLDHVKLVQQYEHLPRELAVDYIYELMGEQRPLDSNYDILARVAERLHSNINADKPMAFFTSRGIKEKTLNDFIVGYSPSFDWLKGAITDIPSDKAAKLELMRPDMFDDAIVYPLFDALGRVCGFKSRPFRTVTGMKYIGNTRNFPLKPTRVYGIHLIGSAQRQVVMVEGPNDVLGLKSNGIANVAGAMGSELKDVEKYLDEHGFSDIVFLADGDHAGKMATLKAPPTIRVAQIPDGDPDEFVNKNGVLPILDLIKEAKYPIEIQLDMRVAKMPNNMTGKISFIKEFAKDLSDGLPPILLSVVKGRIAELANIPLDDVDSIFSMVEPDSDKLERKILYHVASNGALTEDIKMEVKTSMFANPRLRKMAEHLWKGLSTDEEIAKVEGLTESDIGRFIDISKRRHVKEALTRITDSVFNTAIPLDEVVAKTVSKLSDISTDEIEVMDTRTLLELGVQNIKERSANSGKFALSFGANFPKLDKTLQGIRPNSMYVLAATQGTGKSALAFDWALNLACEQNLPVLWVSLEMSRNEMADRAMSKLSGLDAYKIQTGSLSDDDTNVLNEYVIKFATSPLYYVDCGSMNIQQIVALVKKMKITKDIKVVFIDYLQLIDSGTREQSMYERIGHISRMVKSGIAMDKNIGIPVVAIAQLARLAAKVELPTAEYIAESYKIAQDADVLMAMKKLSDREIADGQLSGTNLGNMLLHIDKNRAGFSKVKVGLLFDQQNLRFREVIQ